MTVTTEPGLTWLTLPTNKKLNDNEPTFMYDKTGKQDVKDLMFASPKMTKTFRECWVDIDLGSAHNIIVITFNHKGTSYTPTLKIIDLYHKANWYLINNNILETMAPHQLNHQSNISNTNHQ